MSALGGQVRELDAAQSHVRATLAAITVIVDRSNCIYGVREALASGHFETAAGAHPPALRPSSTPIVTAVVRSGRAINVDINGKHQIVKELCTSSRECASVAPDGLHRGRSWARASR